MLPDRVLACPVPRVTCAMAVMAKAPQPGRCKTRLCPPLTADQSALLARAFLRDITGNLAAAARAAPISAFVAYAPEGSAALFDGMLAPGTRLLLADGRTPAAPGVAGFGLCLLHALRGLLAQGFAAACVVNADSPTLPTAILCRAADALARPGDRVVLGPAEDGGYYLLGVKQAHAHLLADIDWSTAAVAEQTLRRIEDAGLDLVLLPRWYDVDEPAALDRLARALAEPEAGAYHAPASRQALASLGLHPHTPRDEKAERTCA